MRFWRLIYYYKVQSFADSGTTSNAGITYVRNGDAATTTNGSRSFTAGVSSYNLRIVKTGNSLLGSYNRSGTTYTNLGTAQAFDASFFEGAKLQLFAANATTDVPLTVTYSVTYAVPNDGTYPAFVVPYKLSSPVSTLVNGFAANVPFTVSDADGTGLKAVLFGKTVDVVNGNGTFTFGSSEVKTGDYTIDLINGDSIAAQAAISVVELPAKIWVPDVILADGVATVIFAADIAPSVNYVVKVGADAKDFSVGDRSIALSGVAENDSITISKVKYPDLFPSYSFTFTVVANK